MIVLDTNVALDLLVFRDPACTALDEVLTRGHLRWIATTAMREEFARVLGYPVIAARLERLACRSDIPLAAFDARAQCVPAPQSAPCRCTDPDDQMFIDLAVAHRAQLLSKDLAVLRLRRRLDALGVRAARSYSAVQAG